MLKYRRDRILRGGRVHLGGTVTAATARPLAILASNVALCKGEMGRSVTISTNISCYLSIEDVQEHCGYDTRLGYHYRHEQELG